MNAPIPHEALTAYKRLRQRQGYGVLALALLAVGVAFVSLSLGSSSATWRDLWNPSNSSYLVLYEIRLPRILAAVLAGAVLAVGGLVMQNVLRNPMASPYTLGISGAAAFGAACAIVFSPGQQRWWVPACALAASGVCVFVILGLTKLCGNRPSILILGGIMLHALFSAATSALQYFSSDQKAAEILFWSFGDLNRATPQINMLLLSLLVPALAWLYTQRWNFALLATGDENAQATGLSPQKFRMRSLLVVSLLSASVVSQYGTIAFVGLVVPHIVRLIFRDDGPWLLIATTLMGSLFMLGAADIAQHLFRPVILPVGIVTAFFGAPFFLALLFIRRDN